jgi:hypothetical protein
VSPIEGPVDDAESRAERAELGGERQAGRARANDQDVDIDSHSTA